MQKLVLHLLNGTTIEVPRESIMHFVRDHTYETYIYMYPNSPKTIKRVTRTKLVIVKSKLAASQNTAKDAIEQLTSSLVYKYDVHADKVETYYPASEIVDGIYTEPKQTVEDEGDTFTLQLVI
ncbi:hypothetical protein QCM8_143 [Bacillus phage QCM8]|nr:hypothetical protein QCM8_143 [Bacillus phage QCM8]